AHGQAVPALQEVRAGKRGRVFVAGELFAVASGAFAIVKRLSALGLIGGVDAVPHRVRLSRLLDLLPRRAQKARRHQSHHQLDQGGRDSVLLSHPCGPCERSAVSPIILLPGREAKYSFYRAGTLEGSEVGQALRQIMWHAASAVSCCAKSTGEGACAT